MIIVRDQIQPPRQLTCKPRFLLLLWILVLVGFAVSCENAGSHDNNANKSQPEFYSENFLEKQKDRREDEMGGLDEMDQFAAKYSVDSLREKRLSRNTYELRIWVGAGPNITRGLILAENNVRHLPPIGEIEQEKLQQAKVLSPVSGWETFKNDLENSGLMYFPEEPDAEKVEPSEDSNVVILEMKKGNTYRYVFYGAPCYSKGVQAELLLAAIERLDRQLGINFYDCP